MSAWDILEIEPTNNLAIIKKAYAKKLKIYHPEDDPEGYQRLREAYDRAVKRQKYTSREERRVITESEEIQAKHQENPSVEESTLADTEQIEEYENEPLETTQFQDDYFDIDEVPTFSFADYENQQHEDPVDAFVSKAKNLYQDFHVRIDADKWDELLNSDVMWNIKLKGKISERLLSFFQEHHYLPKKVWQLLENNFHWNETAYEENISFSVNISDSFLTNLFLQIKKKLQTFCKCCNQR
ncbi:hypothetical protein J9303_19765 [Bacillaceae bacterium Marseille-Q3522]|nr:hypothetical protein [Bacillaceae bacterium Marseille-Q3522]